MATTGVLAARLNEGRVGNSGILQRMFISAIAIEVCGLLFSSGLADAAPWVELTGGSKLNSWRTDDGGEAWSVAGDVRLNDKNPKRLDAKSDGDVIVSHGDSPDLLSKASYGDVDVHLEFVIPRGSNSGVKLMGRYEIQIYDSHNVPRPSANDCGGIYPRAERKPKYHLIDEGTPPRLNAAKPAGEWQSLDIEFMAPRFDTDGKKLSSARFAKVALNGQLIHENVDVAYPTGAAWRLDREVARGPLLLQGDHGPVAFRNVRVREREERDKNPVAIQR